MTLRTQSVFVGGFAAFRQSPLSLRPQRVPAKAEQNQLLNGTSPCVECFVPEAE